MATCSSADSVLDAAVLIKENGTKLNTFVNGTENQTVQLGTGDPTPTLRNMVANAVSVVTDAMEEAITNDVEANQAAITALQSGKADKVLGATSGDIAALNASGNLVDSGVKPGDKADKVPNATNGHLAGLNASGNLTDSGIAVANVQTKLSSFTENNLRTTNASGFAKDSGKAIADVQFKLSSATANHILSVASSGFMQDSGIASSDVALKDDISIFFYDSSILTNRGYCSIDGVVHPVEDTSYNYAYSDLLAINFLEISISASVRSSSIGYVCFYDDENKFIVSLSNLTDSDFHSIAVPQGALKFRLCGARNAPQNFIAKAMLWSNVSDISEKMLAFNSLTINRNNDYPLKKMIRDGITSKRSSFFDGVLLDIKVINAKPGKYYQISYFQNKVTLNEVQNYNWGIIEFDADTFETNSSYETVVSVYSVGTQPQIDKSKGIQTITLFPSSTHEKYSDLQFVITLDASKLPEDGIYFSTDANWRDGYSWIIDPSCYILSRQEKTSLNLNGATYFPFKQMTRGGLTSQPSVYFKSLFIDVRVVGATKGCYYQLAYMKNGNTSLSANIDGFIFFEYSAEAYSSEDGDFSRVVDYRDDCPEIQRDGNIHTICVSSSVKPGLDFYITIDTSLLPAYGTPIQFNAPSVPGYTWIIDPSRYTYRQTAAVSTGKASGLSYTCSPDGLLQMTWRSSGSWYRVWFGVNGFNDLPNIKTVQRAPYTPNVEDAVFATVNTTSSDWLPPMVVGAASNGDGTTRIIYTGGNHGSDGSAGGVQTARNILYQISADGQMLPLGGTSSHVGNAEKISILVVNELMGYNTITLGRYILKQTFFVEFHPGGLEVVCEVLPYEDISVTTDNGPQMNTGGYQGTMLFVGGEGTQREAFDSTKTSGQSQSYPNAWAVVLQGNAGGQQVSWMDRSFGVGNLQYVDGNIPLVRGGGEANTKFYQAAVRAYTGGHAFTAGTPYKWRGGYSWQEPSPVGSSSIDSTFSYWKNGEMHQAVIVSPSEYTVLPD